MFEAVSALKRSGKAFDYLVKVKSADFDKLKKKVDDLEKNDLNYLLQSGLIEERREQEKTVYALSKSGEILASPIFKFKGFY